ncbi:alpha/beta fold hydrolase [Pyxidicoccus fallax]|uniref:Alpha/beta fold hydrolase n=1 Tax=Pyxidicoccus fallax TaxID=394095 RepID=A0A848LHR0_9BACT|nr:alpha/beta fold hydrolase [Pyxidicoccus fallax]NMO16318.1 alpha/beta fold hydrolase [Pyxidicoccus fallax]NPC82269.1 alpha/beta fold hydrolase [Pyxidicoccus fallax]
MDPRKTAPFDLGGGEDACLLLHGFTGSPWDMRPLGEALAARGMRAVAPRLPGHGTTPQALLHVTWRDWQAAAEHALHALSGHRNVFVAGLSMGSLLALGLAARHPEQVRALALVAPAVRFRGPRMFLIRQLARTPLLEWARPWAEKTGTDISDPEALAEAPVLPAFPVARLRDLCTLQNLAVRDVTRVRCPTLVAVAEQDHVVDPEGGRWLARRLTSAPSVRVLSLREGYHVIPRDTAGPLLAAELGSFLEQWRDGESWEAPAAGA